MSVSLDLKEVRTIESGGIFRVYMEVEYASEMPKEIFIHNTETEEYAHVATMADMALYPVGKDASVAARANYYRALTLTRDFTNEIPANEFGPYTRLRVELLVEQYVEGFGDFPGTDHYNFTG